MSSGTSNLRQPLLDAWPQQSSSELFTLKLKYNDLNLEIDVFGGGKWISVFVVSGLNSHALLNTNEYGDLRSMVRMYAAANGYAGMPLQDFIDKLENR